MNEKKTRKFLVATSALVAAMSGAAAQALPGTASAAPAVVAKTQPVNNDFVIGPTAGGAHVNQDSGHQSHASHASHASHVSSSQ